MNEFTGLHGWHYRYTASLSWFIPLDTIGSRCNNKKIVVTRRKKHLSLFLYRAQNLQSLISYSKYNLKLTIFLIWIWRSDIRFLTGNQNFFFVPRSWKDEKKSSSISLPILKLWSSFLFHDKILHSTRRVFMISFCTGHISVITRT